MMAIYWLVLLLLCHSCVFKRTKLLKTFTGCFPNGWSLRWAEMTQFALFLLKCLVQNIPWEEETGSKYVSGIVR